MAQASTNAQPTTEIGNASLGLIPWSVFEDTRTLRRARRAVRQTVVAGKGHQRIEAPKDYEHRSIPIPGLLLEPLRMQIAGRQPKDPGFFGARTRTWLRNRTFRNGWFDLGRVL